jgi:hypothetical protein
VRVLNIEHELFARDAARPVDGLDGERHALFQAVTRSSELARVG